MTPKNYIKRHRHHVLTAVDKTPLFASVVMAQAMLESSDYNLEPGKSFQALLGNNHFGAGADGDEPGMRIFPKFGPGHLKTMEVPPAYRCFDNVQESFDEHVQSIMKSPYCKITGVFTALTPQAQAKALQRAGVRGRPHYARTLIRIIKKFELYLLDWYRSEEWPEARASFRARFVRTIRHSNTIKSLAA